MAPPDLPIATETVIPQRGRWQIATRIVSLEIDDETAKIVCEGDFDEAYVEGHFPDQPIVPGVALLEGLAQSMLALSAHVAEQRGGSTEGTPFLAGFDKARFRAPVIPPATVQFEVKLLEQRGPLTMASGTARCNGTRVCTARMTGAVLPPEATEGRT
jgi:3-hydroxyacyl-[acyl-carrier-protein] dehydratase